MMPMITLAGLVRSQARSIPDRPALIWGSDTWTFADLDERSSRVAKALAAEGVGSQDRVAYWGKNSPTLFELLFGAAKINAVTVAVNWRLALPEVAFVLNDSGAQLLVV